MYTTIDLIFSISRLANKKLVCKIYNIEYSLDYFIIDHFLLSINLFYLIILVDNCLETHLRLK